jgi:phosphohistidine phosphatase
MNYPFKKIRTNMDIYSGDLKSLYRIIHYCKNEHQSVLLVGHNPLITYFAESLCNEDFGNIPTCGIVGIHFELDGWAKISVDTGELDFFIYPKMYR